MTSLPQFISLAINEVPHVSYRHSATRNREFVIWGELNVYSTYSKIEVERGKTNPNLVHLRFCANNKYWERRSPDPDDSFVVVTSNQPEEDTSKLSCTLFRPTLRIVGGKLTVTFHHVQSGRSVRLHQPNRYLIVSNSTSGAQTFTVTDWESLIILPKLVTFKGFNDKYLKSTWIQGHEYHQFSGDDGNKNETTYEITMTYDGWILIRSNFFRKNWRGTPTWIWADTTSTSHTNNDIWFWPVKIDDNTIALRSLGNNMFCRSLTADRKTDCLSAVANTAIRETLLVVQEPVSSRDIFNVRFRLADARIYDEEPFIAGRGRATNNTGQESTLAISVSYEDTHTYTFTSNWSITAGVSYTFTTGIPSINEHSFTISTEVTKSWEWSETTEESKKSEATYTAPVPPWTTVQVNYVGTKAKCNIPFSYTKRVRLSTTGAIVNSEHTDGVFIGVNAYNYDFEQVQQSRL